MNWSKLSTAVCVIVVAATARYVLAVAPACYAPCASAILSKCYGCCVTKCDTGDVLKCQDCCDTNGVC